MKQLLGEKRNKKAYNVDNFMNVELSTDANLIPNDIIVNTVDSYSEYLREKDSSKKYRLIFTINPICTNILFNPNTEIVYKEGSDDCKFVSNIKSNDINDDGFRAYRLYKGLSSQKYTRDELIQDTGYSHPKAGGLVYHCGADIFNNHTLRNQRFVTINKLKSSSSNKALFNTIKDFLRDKDGNEVKEKILKSTNIGHLNSNPISLHQYQYSTIKSFRAAITDGIVESNGWVGFINPSSLNIPNFNGNVINKCLNNNKAGEQIDMYPDRSLYSFTPKYNKYRNRAEKNWDYCLTYPFENYYGDIVENTFYHENGIKCYIETDLTGTILDSKNGDTSGKIYLRSQIKNNFKEGTLINFSFINTQNRKISRTNSAVRIESIGYMGEDTMHYFSIDLRDIIVPLSEHLEIDDEGNVISIIKNKELKNIEIRVRREEGGINCQYYFRKFRKLPNFKHSDVYADDCITEEEIKQYSGKDKDFSNTLNKLAFSENIFSDSIAQIVYEDDIITEGIKDNLGRDISEIYLTIIKRNAGHDKWYKEKIYNTDDIEFSHCFGKITSGIDIASNESDYNIHKLHNAASGYALPLPVACLENDITINNSEFLGDIVEFSPYSMNEKVLEDVYHRFNTVQRELTKSNEYGKILYDEIQYDDYDVENEFKVETREFNVPCVAPEGYFYKPHYKVTLKEYDNTVNQGEHIRIITTSGQQVGNFHIFTTSIPYYIMKGDIIYFYDKDNKKRIDGVVDSVDGSLCTKIIVKVHLPKKISDYYVYRMNTEMPSSAYELNDGTGRYMWRELKQTISLTQEDETYDAFFTNGCNYYHTNINFYLKRQDPYGEFGLNNGINIDGVTNASQGKFKDVSTAVYIKEGEGNIC